MGNDIETGSTTGFDYWAAYVGGAKIKTDGPTLMYLINEYSLNYLQCLAPSSCQS